MNINIIFLSVQNNKHENISNDRNCDRTNSCNRVLYKGHK